MVSEHLADTRIDDCLAAAGRRRFWRYSCGFVFGLAVAAILVICTIPFVDELLVHNMDYGPNHQLQDTPVLLGLTAPDLLGWTWVGLIIGVPLTGVVVQQKPLFAALNSWQALLIGTVCAVTFLGLAMYLVAINLFYWAYLYI